MKLSEKLQTIANPRIPKLTDYGENKKFSDFWNDFIAPLLPKPETVIKWYNLLLKYVQDTDIVFAIRAFNSANKTEYDTLRRGFYNTTDNDYSLFYTDNFFSAYFAKMAIDGYIPDYQEFKQAMISREFPARFGRHDKQYELVKAAFDITGKKGKDPLINTSGYKIAHIFDTGRHFHFNNRDLGINEICQKYCPRGKYEDWIPTKDKFGECYVRHLGKLDDDARKLFVAHFLRMTCPLNYVLTPKKDLHITPVCQDIAEYTEFQYYAMKKFSEIYGNVYKDFISHIMTDINIDTLNPEDEIIDIKYGNKIKLKTTDFATWLDSDDDEPFENPKPKTTSKISKGEFISLGRANGYDIPFNARLASLNSATDVYWLNPVDKDIKNGFTILCNDTSKREIYILQIPANALDAKKLKTRSSASNSIMFNVCLRYRDSSFRDTQSGLTFGQYLIGSFKY